MALSANKNRENSKALGLEVELINDEVVFGGSFSMMTTNSHATSASQGRGDVYSDIEGAFWLGGWWNSPQTGDTSASPTVKSRTFTTGCILRKETVAGGTGDRTDNLQPVYATDDDTITFTRPTLGTAVGFAVKHITGTTYDLRLFSAAEYWLHSMGGGGQYTWFMGSFPVTQAASANVLTGIEAPHHGKFTKVYTIHSVAQTATASDVDVNLEIGGTNVTGGVVSITGVIALATKTAGTAVTAENVFHEGDLIDVEIVVNTAATAGTVNLYAEVQLLPGL